MRIPLIILPIIIVLAIIGAIIAFFLRRKPNNKKTVPPKTPNNKKTIPLTGVDKIPQNISKFDDQMTSHLETEELEVQDEAKQNPFETLDKDFLEEVERVFDDMKKKVDDELVDRVVDEIRDEILKARERGWKGVSFGMNYSFPMNKLSKWNGVNSLAFLRFKFYKIPMNQRESIVDTKFHFVFRYRPDEEESQKSEWFIEGTPSKTIYVSSNAEYIPKKKPQQELIPSPIKPGQKSIIQQEAEDDEFMNNMREIEQNLQNFFEETAKTREKFKGFGIRNSITQKLERRLGDEHVDEIHEIGGIIEKAHKEGNFPVEIDINDLKSWNGKQTLQKWIKKLEGVDESLHGNKFYFVYDYDSSAEKPDWFVKDENDDTVLEYPTVQDDFNRLVEEKRADLLLKTKTDIPNSFFYNPKQNVEGQINNMFDSIKAHGFETDNAIIIDNINHLYSSTWGKSQIEELRQLYGKEKKDLTGSKFDFYFIFTPETDDSPPTAKWFIVDADADRTVLDPN